MAIIYFRAHTAIPGSADAVSTLQSLGKRVVFVTNNSVNSKEQYGAKFEKLGFKGIKKVSQQF